MASLASSSTIDVTPSTVSPDCVEIASKYHPCTPMAARSDQAGEGAALKFWPVNELACDDPNNASCDLIQPPLCSCSNSGLRSGLHLVDCGNGEPAIYVEPAPRTFTTYSNATSINVAFAGGDTNDDKPFIGPERLGVRSACYPLRVQFTIEACAYRPSAFENFAEASHWIGYAKWWSTVDGQFLDLESQTIGADAESVADVCEVFGYGGHFDHRTKPYILAPNSTLDLALEFRVRLEGPVTGTYNLRINDARIRADITEVTSLASTEMDVC